ncbi:MAG TPA: transaldolase [Candidatus Kapabacteria bacterium]|nr:transaldolase [Candidatus Kapabacteria bacterium]
MANRWHDIEQYGQSLWYDNMARKFIGSGALKNMIGEVGLKGITSNPAIFEKSISTGTEYDSDIQKFIREGKSTSEIYDLLTTEDIRAAADVMREVYNETAGVDGYVSIEVNPDLAHETASTVAAAKRLWETVDRPNIMIKIPGTPAGIPAIREVLAEGINVNITLLFGIENYSQVAQAYIDALRQRLSKGQDITNIASVASFFLSRVDTNIDKTLNEKIQSDPNRAEEYRSLLGKAAVANAKLAYERFQEIFYGQEFADLAAQGAKVQRCLWASVSTKNPDYRDVMYIEPLIGPETVTTVPDETIAAFADHGEAANTLALDMKSAHDVVDRLAAIGIDTERVADELQVDGVKKFEDAFRNLTANLEKKRAVIEEAIA